MKYLLVTWDECTVSLLFRMVNPFLVVAMRSGGRDHLDEIIDDFDEADDDMKEFALHYAKDIVAQGRLKVFDRKLFVIQ